MTFQGSISIVESDFLAPDERLCDYSRRVCPKRKRRLGHLVSAALASFGLAAR